MRKSLAVASAAVTAVVCLSVLSAVTSSSTKTLYATCTRVLDGDTLECKDARRNLYTIRFLKNDAPEIVHNKTGLPNPRDQPFGRESRRYVESKCFGKPIVVKYVKYDNYRRILGTIFVGDEELNLSMVKSGMAWYPAKYDKQPDATYQDAMSFAKKNKLGLWSDESPVDPSIWRKSTNAAR